VYFESFDLSSGVNLDVANLASPSSYTYIVSGFIHVNRTYTLISNLYPLIR